MAVLKWGCLSIVGLFALLIVSSILAPPDPQAQEQDQACRRVSITADSEIWSPAVCDLVSYKTMMQSQCAKVHQGLFDRLACYVPTKSEYAKKNEEDAITARGEADIERDKKRLEEVMKKIRAAPAKQNLP